MAIVSVDPAASWKALIDPFDDESTEMTRETAEGGGKALEVHGV